MTVHGIDTSTPKATHCLRPVEKLQIKNDRFYVAIMAIRYGAMAFMTAMEYRHFPPTTSLNDQFQITVIDWKGFKWYLMEVPADCAETARETAIEFGMRFADGIPTMPNNGKPSYFPANGPNVFTLENRERKLTWHTPLITESEECEKIIEEAKNS